MRLAAFGLLDGSSMEDKVQDIRRYFGREPEGAHLVVQAKDFGFGSYGSLNAAVVCTRGDQSVVCYYNNDRAAVDYAHRIAK